MRAVFTIVFAALLTFCTGQTLSASVNTFNTPGPAPDVVGSFYGLDWVGAVNAGGIFTFQGSQTQNESTSGIVLSHRCNPDGSWDAVWEVNAYSAYGATVNQTPYCEHGSVIGNQYVSYYSQTTSCPLTSLSPPGTYNRNLTEVPNSNLGALTGHQYCNKNFDRSLLTATPAQAIFTPAMAPMAGAAAAGRKML